MTSARAAQNPREEGACLCGILWGQVPLGSPSNHPQMHKVWGGWLRGEGQWWSGVAELERIENWECVQGKHGDVMLLLMNTDSQLPRTSPQLSGSRRVSKIPSGLGIWILLMNSVLCPKVASATRGRSWQTIHTTTIREAGEPWWRNSSCSVSSLTPDSTPLHLSEPLTLVAAPPMCIPI